MSAPQAAGRPAPGRTGSAAPHSCSLAVIAILLAACLGGCGGDLARTAPYRVRPDSVDPGNLRGPFTGRVVDAASDEPVAGALVYATWTLTTGYGVTAPGGVIEEVVSTDTDGRYRIPRLDELPGGGSVRLTDFDLVIYKRGYVAYRSDRRFFDLGPRQDFAQLRNQVELERWRDDYSHLRHIRYVGGGAALSALTAWENAEAAAELSGIKSGQTTRIASDFGVGRSQTVVAAQLLSEKDVKDITEFDGNFETGPLGDEPDTDVYSSQHFKALGRPQSYDVAVRLWKLPADAADKRYQDITALLPQVEQTDDIADQSFRASEGAIVAVGFIDRKLGVVVMINCGQSQCDEDDDITRLGRRTHAALQRLMPGGVR